jgi:hypothetical protein
MGTEDKFTPYSQSADFRTSGGDLAIDRDNAFIGQCCEIAAQPVRVQAVRTFVFRRFERPPFIRSTSAQRHPDCEAYSYAGLTGWVTSVVTFWVSAVSSLVCVIIASNCLRACVADSAMNSDGDFTPISASPYSNAV